MSKITLIYCWITLLVIVIGYVLVHLKLKQLYLVIKIKSETCCNIVSWKRFEPETYITYT